MNEVLFESEKIIDPIEHKLTHKNINAFFVKYSVDKAQMKEGLKNLHE